MLQAIHNFFSNLVSVFRTDVHAIETRLLALEADLKARITALENKTVVVIQPTVQTVQAVAAAPTQNIAPTTDQTPVQATPVPSTDSSSIVDPLKAV